MDPTQKRDIRGSLYLGRPFGVQMYAHWSLLIIFTLIALSLGGQLFPTWHPEWSQPMIWGVAFGAALLFFVSIAVHELSHALVGRSQGLPIDRITLFVFGGMAHSRGEPSSPKAEFLIAAVGPAVSLLIGIGATMAGIALSAESLMAADLEPTEMAARVGPVASLLLWLGPINILLALFNMVPGFPLDGGRVFRAILWWITGDLRKSTRWASRAGQGVGWLLILTGVLMAFGFQVPIFGTGAIGGIWLMLIGWFLTTAAQQSYQGMLVRSELEGVPVGDLMRRDPVSVGPDLLLSEVVSDYLMRYDQRAFPVRDDGRVVGLICLQDVRRIERAHWPFVTVREVMTPVDALRTVESSADAMHAMQVLGESGVNQVPVVDHGELRGMVQREDIMKWLTLRGGAVPV